MLPEKKPLIITLRLEHCVWIIWGIIVLSVAYLSVPQTSPLTELQQPIYDIDSATIKDRLENSVEFVDKTLQAGLLAPHSQKSGEVTGIHESLGAGVCVFDFNSDGWLDILILRGTGSTHYFGKQEWWQKSKNSVSLYVNKRDGTFSDQTQQSGFTSNSISMGCAIGDLDRDGDQDIFLANRGVNEIWENIEGTSVKRRTNFSENEVKRWSTSASIADLNNDGKLDIYVTNYLDFKPNSLTFEASAGFSLEKGANFDPSLYSGVANDLLMNKGNFAFQNDTLTSGVSNPQGRGLASTVGDINNNGRLDIIVANDDKSENKVFLNTESGFRDVSTSSSLGITSSTPSALLIGLDSGLQDSIYVSSGNTKFSKLYQATVPEKYNDRSDQWRLSSLSRSHEFSWSPATADFNLDGLQDVFVVNGLRSANSDAKKLTQPQPSFLLLNTKARSFAKQSEKLAETSPSISSARCAVSGDFNLDGRPDVLIANNNGLVQLLVNQKEVSKEDQTENWAGFIIAPQTERLYGVGAVVKITTDKRVINHKLQNGTHGFCWQDNSQFSVALDPNEKVLKAELNYRGKLITSSSDLSMRQYNALSGDREFLVEKIKPKYQSRIKLKSESAKLSVIDLLLGDGNFDRAMKELSLLSKSKTQSIAEQAAKLAMRFPNQHQLKIAPELLLSNYESVQLIGVALVRRSEDDRLARWLFGAVNHQSNDIACAAMQALEHFYAEEEAMVLAKFADLDSLIRHAQGNNTVKQHCAINALGETERYKAMRPLLSVLKNTDPTIRRSAIIALGRVREGDAMAGLREQFFAPSETSANGLEIIKSMQQIDSNFNEAAFISEALTSKNASKSLAIIAAITEADKLFIDQKAIADKVLLWYELAKPQLKDADRLNYLKVIKTLDSAISSAELISELRRFSTDSDTQTSNTALRLLLELDSENVQQNLQKLISNGGISLLNDFAGLRLSEPELSQAVALIEKSGVEESRVNEKKRADVLAVLLPRVSSKVRQTFTATLLKKEDFPHKQQMLDASLKSLSQSDLSGLCDSITFLFKNSKKFDQEILKLSEKWPNQLLSGCYGKDALQTIPQAVNAGLSGSAELKRMAIEFIAQRNERWARDLIRELLNQSVQKGKNESGMESLHTIQSLSNKPLPSQVKQLSTIFLSSDKPKHVAASAVKLATNSAWLEKNAGKLENRILGAIEDDEDQLAVELASILHSKQPNKAIKLLLRINKGEAVPH